MESSKPIIVKKSGKEGRERRVLLALVEHYIKTGKPVGSNTLKESDFSNLSSATIRNYFAHLEKEGYLIQQHSSGGRLPTEEAYRLYAAEHLHQDNFSPDEDKLYRQLRAHESREVSAYLQSSAEMLSLKVKSAVFLSSPRFDHDFLIDFRLVSIDHSRCLCILITDFGVVKTELLHLEGRLHESSIKRIEDYFHWKLTGGEQPIQLKPEEEALAHKIYNELIVRYIVGYSNFTDGQIYRTGLSQLIAYSEFQDAAALASSLALFEDVERMRLLLKECYDLDGLKYWIGSDLQPYMSPSANCSIVAVSYHINKQNAGVIGVVGPMRMPYPEIFGLLNVFAKGISESLTRNLYKFKITYRQPQEKPLYIQEGSHSSNKKGQLFLIEDMRP